MATAADAGSGELESSAPAEVRLRAPLHSHGSLGSFTSVGVPTPLSPPSLDAGPSSAAAMMMKKKKKKKKKKEEEEEDKSKPKGGKETATSEGEGENQKAATVVGGGSKMTTMTPASVVGGPPAALPAPPLSLQQGPSQSASSSSSSSSSSAATRTTTTKTIAAAAASSSSASSSSSSTATTAATAGASEGGTGATAGAAAPPLLGCRCCQLQSSSSEQWWQRLCLACMATIQLLLVSGAAVYIFVWPLFWLGLGWLAAFVIFTSVLFLTMSLSATRSRVHALLGPSSSSRSGLPGGVLRGRSSHPAARSAFKPTGLSLSFHGSLLLILVNVGLGVVVVGMMFRVTLFPMSLIQIARLGRISHDSCAVLVRWNGGSEAWVEYVPSSLSGVSPTSEWSRTPAVTLTGANDWTAPLLVSGLAPGTGYEARVVVRGTSDTAASAVFVAVGVPLTFTTLEVSHGTHTTVFGVASGLLQTATGDLSGLHDLVSRRYGTVFLLGGCIDVHNPSPLPSTLESHHAAYRRLHSDTAFAALGTYSAVVAVPSHADVGGSARSVEQEEGGGGDSASSVGVAAFLSYFGAVNRLSANVSSSSPNTTTSSGGGSDNSCSGEEQWWSPNDTREDGEALIPATFGEVRVGPSVSAFVLDLVSAQEPLEQLIGSRQRALLTAWLSDCALPSVRVLASPYPFTRAVVTSPWAAASEELEDILEVAAQQSHIEKLILVSGSGPGAAVIKHGNDVVEMVIGSTASLPSLFSSFDATNLEGTSEEIVFSSSHQVGYFGEVTVEPSLSVSLALYRSGSKDNGPLFVHSVS